MSVKSRVSTTPNSVVGNAKVPKKRGGVPAKIREKKKSICSKHAGPVGIEGMDGAGAAPVDPMIQAAMDELKTLGGCCKDSDNVLEKINSTHENISRQGVSRCLLMPPDNCFQSACC